MGNGDDRTAHSCNSDHDITDVGGAACGYCLSTSESDGTIGCGQTDVMCQLGSADDLLHVLSNSHLKTVVNGSEQRSCAGNTTYADNIAANTLNGDISDKMPIGAVGFKAKLRVNVETLSELELWQKDFAERSKTTMRYANVSICTGKKTLYKVNIVSRIDYI